MKKQSLIFAAALCGLTTLNSCVKEVTIEQMGGEPTSRLSVLTRSTGEEELVTPMRLYVFSSDETCVAVQTIEEGATMRPFLLTEGTYDVFAIGGADDERYALPSQQQAKKDAEIKLNTGKTLDDLMTASAHVELADGESEQLTLSLQRQVMLLESATIRDVPTEFDEVTIQISPLQETLLLNGTLSGSGGLYNVTLKAKQSDATIYELPSEAYLFPSVGKPTITVKFKQGSETKSYAYVCKDPLPANYKLTIDGTYKAEQGVTISGTITGATWSGEKAITLTFNEKENTVTGSEDGTQTNITPDDDNSDNSDNGDTNTSETIVAGQLYKGCYVLSVNTTTNKAVLLSTTQKEKLQGLTATNIESSINTAVSEWSVSGISGNWRLPTREEIDNMFNERTQIQIGTKTANSISTAFAGYFYNDSGTLKSASISSGSTVVSDKPSSQAILRPVIDIDLPSTNP